MDFMNADWMDELETAMSFAVDGTAARTHLALRASQDSDFASFDDCYDRHTRACEVAIASLFDGA